MSLNAQDQQTVEHVTASAIAAGPAAVVNAVKIHTADLARLRDRRDRTVAELDRIDRAIAMRQASVDILAASAGPADPHDADVADYYYRLMSSCIRDKVRLEVFDDPLPEMIPILAAVWTRINTDGLAPPEEPHAVT